MVSFLGETKEGGELVKTNFEPEKVAGNTLWNVFLLL